MKIRLVVPDVNETTDRPDACRYCGHWRLHRHGPSALSSGDYGPSQSQRTVVLAALLYGLGLSCTASAAVLAAFGAGVALRQSRPAGAVWVLGADETLFRVRGREVLVGFVVDAQQGQTLGFEVLYSGEAQGVAGVVETVRRRLGRRGAVLGWACRL